MVKFYIDTSDFDFCRSYCNKLYIGDNEIAQYYTFDGGICFKLYHPKYLHNYDDKDIYLFAEFFSINSDFIVGKFPTFDKYDYININPISQNEAMGY